MKKLTSILILSIFVGVINGMEEPQSLEQTSDQYSFDLILLQNKCNERLHLRIYDADNQNLRDLAFGDLPGSIIVEGCLEHYFILKPNKTAGIALFRDTEQHKKIKWPIEVRVYGKDDAPFPDSTERSQFGILITKEGNTKELRRTFCFEKKELAVSDLKDAVANESFPTYKSNKYICGFEMNRNHALQFLCGPEEIRVRTARDVDIPITKQTPWYLDTDILMAHRSIPVYLLINNIDYNPTADRLCITKNTKTSTYSNMKACIRS